MSGDAQPGSDHTQVLDSCVTVDLGYGSYGELHVLPVGFRINRKPGDSQQPKMAASGDKRVGEWDYKSMALLQFISAFSGNYLGLLRAPLCLLSYPPQEIICAFVAVVSQVS